MTITLTVDEVRSYQGSIHDWMGLRARHQLETMHDIYTDHRVMLDLKQVELNKRMEAWTQEHPMPRILPQDI